MNLLLMEKQLKEFLLEDIGYGDPSSDYVIDQLEGDIEAIIHAKAEGVICGVNIAKKVFELIDQEVSFECNVMDGEYVTKGTVILRVKGNPKTILKGERLALNLLQRLSGIATMAHIYQEKIIKYDVYVTDTRKTTPGLRMFEKYAVKIGGARNHRFGLYDAVMLKDNHIKLAGSIPKAIENVRKHIPHTMKVEVEVENIEQVKEAVASKADIIMLDNMDIPLLKEAVTIIGDKAITEASGGITIDNLEEVAKTGVKYISVGALTHSYKALDISLDIFDIKA